jgi:hypothetical protein
MSAFLKSNLIENHGLRGDEPDCETNHQRAERERSTAGNSCCSSAIWRIANFENAIVFWAIKLRSLINPINRIVC